MDSARGLGRQSGGGVDKKERPFGSGGGRSLPVLSPMGAPPATGSLATGAPKKVPGKITKVGVLQKLDTHKRMERLSNHGPGTTRIHKGQISGATTHRRRRSSVKVDPGLAAAQKVMNLEGNSEAAEQSIAFLKGIIPHKICGFGMGSNMSMDAVLYKARIDQRANPVINRYHFKADTGKSKPKSLEEEVGDELSELLRPDTRSALSSSRSSRANEPCKNPIGRDEENSENEGDGLQDEDGEKLEPDQRVALTLNNWCLDDENSKIMIKEGGLRALQHLAVNGDKKTQKYVVSAYHRLSQRPSLRLNLLQSNAVWALSQLSNTITKLSMGRHCAAAICFLSMVPGEEQRAVEEGAVVAMTYLISLSEQKGRTSKYSIAPICLQALFNLTCVDKKYPGIDKVLRALITYSLISSVDSRPVLARGLANCSYPPLALSLKMVEDNAVSVLIKILHDPSSRFQRANTSTRLTVAATLLNIAQARHCRTDLIMKGIVKSLHGSLEAEDDAETLHCMSVVMHHLSQDFPGRLRCLYDEAIDALRMLYEKNRSTQTIRMVSSTLMHYSAYEDCIKLMISKHSLQLLNDISRLVQDQLVAHNCVFTYCNMLTQDESREDMLEGGALHALLGLADVSDNESYLQAMAITLFNMTCGQYGNQLVESGILEALLQILEKKPAPHIQKHCLASIANIASMTEGSEGLVSKGIIDCLIHFLKSPNPEVQKQSAIALLIICEDVSEKVHGTMDSRALTAVSNVSLATECLETKAALGSLLAWLSFTPRLRTLMMGTSMGGPSCLNALVHLSKGDDLGLRGSCATCFCNFSCDELQRSQLVCHGVVRQVLEISNTYGERTQEDCAKCLCNLSCYPETHTVMVQEGALQTLMMMIMVRSAKETTMMYSAMALLNMIGKSHLDKMLEEGIAQAFSELAAGSNSEETLSICSRAFCSLSCYPKAREKIAERPSTLRGLFSLSRSPVMDTKVNCCRATCNLVLYKESRVKATNGGALGALKILAVTKIKECMKRCPCALAIMACDPDCQQRIIKDQACTILIYLTQNAGQDILLVAIRAVCCLAYHKPLRRALVDVGSVSALICVVLSGGKNFSMLREDLARAFCYLAVVKDNRQVMVKQRVVLALVLLCKRSNKNQNVEALCALTVQYLSWSKCAHEAIVKEGGISLLVDLLMEGHNQNNMRDVEVARDCVVACSNISQNEQYLEALMKMRVIGALQIATNVILAQSNPEQDMECIIDVIKTIYNISQQVHLREAVVRQGGTAPLVQLAPYAHKAGQQSTSCALCNLSKVNDSSCREQMVDEGAIPVLSELSSNENIVTQKMCTIALANLSAFAKVQGGAVSSLLKVAFKDDAGASMFLPEEPPEEYKSSPSSPSGKKKTASRKASKAKHILQAYIHTGIFFNAAEKRAPGVFHNSYTKNLRHIIDLPPPVDLRSAESSTGLRRQSYYGDSIFEAAVTRSLKYPRIAAGGACIDNRPFMEPSEKEPVFYLQKQSLQSVEAEEEDGSQSKEEGTGEFLKLPLPRIDHIPTMHALTDAHDSSMSIIKEEEDKEDDSKKSSGRPGLPTGQSFRRSRSSADTPIQKDMFPKILLKINGKRKGEKFKDDKDQMTILPRVKSTHRGLKNNAKDSNQNSSRQRQSRKHHNNSDKGPGIRSSPINTNYHYQEKKI